MSPTTKAGAHIAESRCTLPRRPALGRGWRTIAALAFAVTLLSFLQGIGWANDDNDNIDSGKKINSENQQQTIVPAGASPGISPDLKIEYAGFNSPSNTQLIKFKVTNVGTGPSVATVARVVTSSPEPTPWLRELDVPELAPGASAMVFYPLADTCSGHIVRALVNAPQDSNPANNFVEAQVCPPPPPVVPVSPDTTVDYGACAVCDIPLALRPGSHPFELLPVAARTFAKGQTLGDCEYVEPELTEQVIKPLFPLVAGFHNASVAHIIEADCQRNGVWQAAFKFDLTPIRDVWATGHASVFAADLTFSESPYAPLYGPGRVPPIVFGQWITPGEGTNYQPTNTCWPRLARPTINWSLTGGGLVPNEVIAEAGEIGHWSLLDQVGSMLGFSELDSQGFVILGHNEEMHFNNAVCQSKIENVKLTGTYVVRQN